MEERIIKEDEAPKREPDIIFTQVIDDRPYHVQVFFPESCPENCADTFQEKIERMLHTELMKAIDEGGATDWHNTPYERVGSAEPMSTADEVPFDIPETWE